MEDTVSPLVRETDQADRARKIWKTWSECGKAFKSGEDQAVNLKLIGGSRYLAFRKAFLLTEPAEEEVKTLRKARPIGLRLAILFGLSAIIGETSVALLTDIH